MTERMTEYVGYKKPIGEGPYDMGVTDVRIVRCRDCKHYDQDIHACIHPNISALRGDVPENWIMSTFEMDFCSYGKPRGEDATQWVAW